MEAIMRPGARPSLLGSLGIFRFARAIQIRDQELSMGSQQVAQMEVACGVAHIASDLFAQSLRRGPTDLIAQALEEREFQWRLFG